MNDKKPTTPAVEPATTEAPRPQANRVVSEQSLEGLAGWLVFWMILFGIGGLGYLVAFFGTIEYGIEDASAMILLIFAPLLSISYLASTVLIALRKRIARWMSLGSIGLGALFLLVNTIVDTTQSESDLPITGMVASILSILVANGLVALYFVVSRRVSQTLVK